MTEYSSVRNHARVAFVHFMHAGDYLDAEHLRDKTFSCLCFNSYGLERSIVCPADVESIVKLNDLIFHMNNELTAAKEKIIQLQQSHLESSETNNQLSFSEKADEVAKPDLTMYTFFTYK